MGRITERHSVDGSDVLAGTLLDARVDLNLHQVKAALFAFKSPLSKSTMLADEIGAPLGGLDVRSAWAQFLVAYHQAWSGSHRIRT
jgi:hypothetical protein